MSSSSSTSQQFAGQVAPTQFQYAEIIGTITTVKVRTRDDYDKPVEFTVTSNTTGKTFKVEYAGFLPIQEGDIITATVAILPTGLLKVVTPPFIQVPIDKESVMKGFIKVLRTTGFGRIKATKLYDAISAMAGGDDKVVGYISEWAAMYTRSKDADMLEPYKDIISADQTKALLKWWYDQRDIRRLHLFGLNNGEINACGLPATEINSRCIDNPLTVPAISIEKCKEITLRQRKVLTHDNIMCGTILRAVWDNIMKRSWFATPQKHIERQFPEIHNVMSLLLKNYDIVPEEFVENIKGHEISNSFLYYKNFHVMESFIADYIAGLVNSDHVDDSAPFDELIDDEHGGTYTRTRVTLTADREYSEDQIAAIQGALDHKISIISGPPGTGKCLAPDTPIVMFDGSVKTAQNIQVNDLLMGPDSKPRRVVSTCTGQDQMYRITPQFGEPFVCNHPHILTLVGPKAYKDEYNTFHYTVKGIPHTTTDPSIIRDDIYDIPLNEYMQNYKRHKNSRMFRTSVEWPEVEHVMRPELAGRMITPQSEGLDYKYIINSSKVRRAYLRQILYTVGRPQDYTVPPSEFDGITANYFDLPQMNSKLLYDLKFLARSLGYNINDRCVRLNVVNVPSPFEVKAIGSGVYCGFELDLFSDGRFVLEDFTVTHNTSVLAEIIKNLELREETYIACSFTGKAVARVKEVSKNDQAATMDRLIAMVEKKNEKKGDPNQVDLKFKWLLMDEASMSDNTLVYRFLKAFKHKFNIILVGDPDQLPPIKAGSFFAQCIKSNVIPHYRLTENHRSYRIIGQKDGIISNTHAMITHDPEYPFTFEETENFSMIDGTVDRVYDILYALFSKKVALKDVVVLCPYNRELVELNATFQSIYNEDSPFVTTKTRDSKGEETIITWKIGDRVVALKNLYDIEVFNGSTGFVKDFTDECLRVDFGPSGVHDFLLKPSKHDYMVYKRGEVGIVSDDPEGYKSEERTVHLLQHAYAITVHKAQGSEWDYVIFYIPPGRKAGGFLCRNLVYTAISRARCAVWTVGEIDEMYAAASKVLPYRCENLSNRLKKLAPDYNKVQISRFDILAGNVDGDTLLDMYGYDEAPPDDEY